MVCHIKDQSGTDRLASAKLENGELYKYHLNTPTVLNSSLAKYQLWDANSNNNLDTLDDMFKNGLKIDKETLVQKVSKNYEEEFKKVYPNGVSYENIKSALDSYLKTLLTPSAFDRYLAGDDNAISLEAKKGLRNFLEFGCKGCHSGITIGGQTIQRFPARNFNYFINVTGEFDPTHKGFNVARFDFNFKPYRRFPFENKGGFLGKDKLQKFRVPILRNVTKTSPYFHNGAVFDLREAVYIMGKYQLGLELTDTQIDEIIEFLKTLEGDVIDYKDLK